MRAGVATGRFIIWTGVDDWRMEVAEIEFHRSGLRARGTQVGIDPLPYRLDYELDAPEDYVTRTLNVTVAGSGWGRSLELVRRKDGGWRAQADERGEVDLSPAGGDPAPLEGARDCDLGLSPLTNLMPVRRYALHHETGSHEYLMAWVAVPELTVSADRQRYEHVRPGVVRFTSLAMFAGFTAELELDEDGLALHYPGLARRAGAE